jgi:Predicted membrane protein
MAPIRHLLLGMVLTATAGFVDAIGFIELGGYFVSFMSGNTTQGGAGIVTGNWGEVGLTLSLVALFFIGSVLGTLLSTTNPRWAPALVTGLVVLGVAATIVLSLSGFGASQSMLILAATAGAQNAILPVRGAVRLGATFVTGTLYVAGQDLAFALRGKAPRWRWAQHMAVWVSLFVGAAIGALAYGPVGIYALFVPLGIYAAFFIGHIATATRT